MEQVLQELGGPLHSGALWTCLPCLSYFYAAACRCAARWPAKCMWYQFLIHITFVFVRLVWWKARILCTTSDGWRLQQTCRQIQPDNLSSQFFAGSDCNVNRQRDRLGCKQICNSRYCLTWPITVLSELLLY